MKSVLSLSTLFHFFVGSYNTKYESKTLHEIYCLQWFISSLILHHKYTEITITNFASTGRPRKSGTAKVSISLKPRVKVFSKKKEVVSLFNTLQLHIYHSEEN